MFRRRRDNRSLPAAVGIVLFFAAFPLLWWNEGEAVRDYTSIKELARSAEPADPRELNPAQEGRTVVLTGGQANPVEPITDALFGLEVTALRLQRRVEMYQWYENIQTRGESEEVSYSLRWEEGRVASEGFRMRAQHTNPVPPFGSETQTAAEVRYGDAFTLSPTLVERLTKFDLVSPEALTPTLERPTHLDGAYLYVGEAPATPQVGDLRVRFDAVPPQPVSLIAAQEGDRLGEVMTSGGRPYAVVMPGALDRASLIAAANTEVRVRTNFMRFGALVLMVLGLRILLNKMTRLVRSLPVIGGLVDAGAWLFAGLLGSACALVTIAVAWFAHRPLLSLVLLAIAALAIELLVLRKRRMRKAEGAPAG